MTTAANTTLATLRAVSRFGFLDFRQEREVAGRFVRQLGIKTPSLATRVGNLSGGNQQKVALARWLAAKPGLAHSRRADPGGRRRGQGRDPPADERAGRRGLAILMISSELPEILGMSDRIAVMHGGTIVGVLDRAMATQEAILELALGHTGKGGPALEPAIDDGQPGRGTRPGGPTSPGIAASCRLPSPMPRCCSSWRSRLPGFFDPIPCAPSW